MTLGEQIRQAREAKNLSQEELASRLQVSRQAVSKWENDLSRPQGINQEMLMQILDMELYKEELVSEVTANIRPKKRWWIWVLVFFVLLPVLVLVLNYEGKKISIPPQITSITFYDEDQEMVESEALWYDASRIESILIQWEGGTPETIKMFATPSGSETMEETELLITKGVRDGDQVELLDADTLKNHFQIHVYFQLDFGNVIVDSELYNVFNHSDLLSE